jgi:translocation and assembly module TamB
MDPLPKSRWRIVRRVVLGVLVAGALTILGLSLYVRTDSFQNMVHRRLVAALERITGGRVELGKFSVVPFRFRVEVRALTIHGKEGPGKVPYVHVPHLIATIKIISVFEKEYEFRSLVLEHPVVHIMVNADGTTNQPTPKIEHASEQTPVEQLFTLSIRNLQVSDGELLWNNEQIPLDFKVSDVAGEMDYQILHRRYDGYVHVGKVDTKFSDMRPFSSALESRFALGERYLAVDALAWTSGHSHFEAKGRIDDFRKPKFAGTYNAKIDLGDLGSVLRDRNLRAGVLEFNGKGTYSAGDFGATGRLFLRDLEWKDELAELRNVNLSTQYSLDPNRVKLTEVQAKLLGGSATGEADITNWQGVGQVGKNGKRSLLESKGTGTLRFREMSAQAVDAALTTRKLPLNRLNFSGAASGTVEAKWRGLWRNAEASFVVEVRPPSKSDPRQVPLNLRARGVYRGASDELELAELNLATRASQINASGKLSSKSSLRFSASTTNLNEWQPIITAFRGPQIPVTLDGRASFNGNAAGKLSNFAIAGHLQASGFETSAPGREGEAERQIQWDALNADVNVSPRMISARRGLLVHGSTSIRFDGTAAWENGNFTDSSVFTGRVAVRDADVADLQSLLGTSYPVTGKVVLRFQAGGTRGDPHGEGQVEITEATIYGQPVSSFTSDLRLSHGETGLNNLVLKYHDAQVTGGAAYNVNSHDLHFSLNGRNFELGQMPEVQRTRVLVEGRMDFTVQGSGTLEAPIISASVHLHDLAFDKERAGDFTFEAVTKGADLQLTGRSEFQKAELAVDGTMHLRNDWPSDLRLRLDHLDVDSILRRYLEKQVTGHSVVAGGVHLWGPVRQPREMNASADLSYLSVDLDNVRVQNDGPVRFSLAKQVLTLDQLRLVGEGTNISAKGTVQLTGEHDLNLRADGGLNMKLLENLSPDLSSAGMVTVAVAIGGNFAKPALQGQLEVAGGSVSSIDLPNGLSEIKGVLFFTQDRLQIQSLTAQIGGGTVNLTGFMTYSPRWTFNINAEGHDVRLRPPGVSATSDAELHLVGSPSDSVLSGDVTVLKLGLTPGFDFARYLEGDKQTVALPQSNPLLNKVRLDIHVVTTPELQMQSSLGRLSGDADLRLRGTAVRPVVIGRVDIMEGDVYFNGTKYRLERGEVTFTGPVGVKPVLDLEASTRVRDYDVTLGVNGSPDKLNFTYRSEPPLPTADIIALLAVGRTQEESAALASSSGGSPFSQEASNVILSQALNATLSSRAQRLFGISRIKVDPQGLNTQTTPTHTAPAVTIEQQLSSNLTLSYSTEVSQTSQQIIQGEYNVTRNVSILAVRDQNGVLSFDVRLRRRHK